MCQKPVYKEKRNLRHGKITFKVNPNNNKERKKKALKHGRKIEIKKST